MTPSGPTVFRRVARSPRRERFDDRAWAAAQTWGLRTVVDLRNENEIGRQPGDPDLAAEPAFFSVVNAPTEDHENADFQAQCFPILDSPEYWQHNLRILPDRVRHTLEAVAAAEPGVLVHCSAGRDRTGLITALLLGMAGVSPSDIADDYAMSVRAMSGLPSHAPTVDRQTQWADDEVTSWIATVRPIAESFAADVRDHLDLIGLDEPHRAQLRDLLTRR